MKTIIAGSREITDYNIVEYAIKSAGISVTSVVSGCARGVDKLGERYAVEHDLPIYQYPADWGTYGKRAGYIRNRQMAQNAEALIAIWDGFIIHIYLNGVPHNE